MLAAGLQLHNVDDVAAAHPRYAAVGPKQDIEVVWQRPVGPPVGAFLYLHGCGNKALDMWATKGHDGFELTACNTSTKKGYCAGLPQEGLLKSTARKRGYLMIAVQGGASSNRGCFHEEDVPRIKAAINHVYTIEKLGELPLILSGMSAGGRTLGELAGSNPGIPLKCAAVMVAELNQKAVFRWPQQVPIGFWYMPKDAVTRGLIYKNIAGLEKRKCKVKGHPIEDEPITKEFLMAGGHGLSEEAANKTMDAFIKAGLLNDKGTLKLDPYNPKPKTRWMRAIEAASPTLKDEIGGFAQQSVVTKLMERSWASHALMGDRTDEIIDFCEKAASAPADAQPAQRALKAKSNKKR